MAVNNILHRALASKDENIKLEAEAGLLRHNDFSVLDQVEGTLLESPAGIPDNSVLLLSSAIRDGIRDAKAVPILARLLSAFDSRVRRAAAHALRETHAASAMGPLSIALNDSDQMVRYDAVLGLSEITGDLSHAPSVDLFKRGESDYLTYWREQTGTKTP
jgi:HEAT repeat protein